MTTNTLTRAVSLTIIIMVITTAGWALQSVSPGDLDRLVSIETRCPTFSWQQADGAAFYEVVAYLLPQDVEPTEQTLTDEREVLYTRVPGGATSWSPSSEQCFQPGRDYVWFVRAVTEMADDQLISATEWSRARYFTIPAAPSVEQVAQALEVLQLYVDQGGDGAVLASAGGSPAGWNSSPGSPRGSSTAPKSVPTASTAIRGHNPETEVEAYGIVGTSASVWGAGVAAANTEGGPDLVLDGSIDGTADTQLSESGINRPSPSNQTFTFQNTDAGRLHVNVLGNLTGYTVDAEELTINGSVVIDDTGAWNGQGSTVPCTGCVASADLANSAVTSAKIVNGAIDTIKLRNGAVTEDKIEHGAVGATHLQNSSITTAKIADGTITAADVDLTSGIYVSRSQLYEREESVTWDMANTVLPIEVFCDDLNDLPLAGSCYTYPNDGFETIATYALHWENSAYLAGWQCDIYNRLGNNGTGKARILCISVP